MVISRYNTADLADRLEQRLSEQAAIKSMCRSLMVRSIRDYVSYRSWRRIKNLKKRKTARELFFSAREWIFSDLNGVKVDCDEIRVEDPLEDHEVERVMIQFDHLMRFKSVCAILGWDVDLVRKKLPELTKADLDRIGPNVMDL